MGSMYFQGKSCVRFHKLFVVYNSIHASFPMYVCLLSKTLFASYFVPPCDISEVVSLSTPDLLSICLNLFNWAFTFTEKSDCGITVTPKKNLKLSIITLITISVRLFQTIWGYAISFNSASVCLYHCRYPFLHHNGVMSTTSHFRDGLQISLLIISEFKRIN